MDSFTIRCAVGEWQRLTTKVMDKKVITNKSMKLQIFNDVGKHFFIKYI